MIAPLLAATNASAHPADLSDFTLISQYPVIGAAAGILFLSGLAADVYLLTRWQLLGTERTTRLRVPLPSWGLREVGLGAALLLGLMLAMGLALAARPPGLLGQLLGQLLLYVGLSTVLVSYLQNRGCGLAAAFGLRRHGSGRSLGNGVLLWLATMPPVFLCSLLLERLLRSLQIPLPPQELVSAFLRSAGGAELSVLVLFAVLVAPVFEELVFRGFAYPALKARLGPGPAMVMIGLLFALMHWHLPSAGPLFVLSLGLCFAYEYTGSVLTPIVLHGLFNSTTVLTLLYVRAQS